ncbi:MAG: hypothetical protein WCI01_03795 [Chlorobiaceae bacterium]
MKKNFVAGVIVSLAMVGMFGGVTFAADATTSKPAVAVTKTEAPVVAKKVIKKKVSKKKVVKKKVAKKVVAKKVEAAPAAPAATK